MKKGIRLMLGAAIMCALTGCYKVNTNMSINSDKSADLEMIYAIDMAAMEEFSNSMNGESESEEGTIGTSENEIDYEEMKNKLEPKGYKVEKYKSTEGEKRWEGVKIVKSFPNIDDISKAAEKKVEFNKLVDENSEFDDSQLFSLSDGKYKAMFVYDLSTGSDGSESGVDNSLMKGYFDLKFVLNLPDKFVSNNATEVSEDGKTLTWNLEMGKINEVNFEFKLSKTANYILPIVIASCIVVASVVVFVVSKSKKNKNPIV